MQERVGLGPRMRRRLITSDWCSPALFRRRTAGGLSSAVVCRALSGGTLQCWPIGRQCGPVDGGIQAGSGAPRVPSKDNRTAAVIRIAATAGLVSDPVRRRRHSCAQRSAPRTAWECQFNELQKLVKNSLFFSRILKMRQWILKIKFAVVKNYYR